MKLTKNPVFLHYFSKFMGILLFVLKYMYISLLLKMINGVSWPAKIMVSPFKVGNVPNFCQIGCFSPSLRKKVENAPKLGMFGCFSKIKLKKKKKFRPTDSNIQKFHLRATQLFFCLILIWVSFTETSESKVTDWNGHKKTIYRTKGRGGRSGVRGGG